MLVICVMVSLVVLTGIPSKPFSIGVPCELRLLLRVQTIREPAVRLLLVLLDDGHVWLYTSVSYKVFNIASATTTTTTTNFE